MKPPKFSAEKDPVKFESDREKLIQTITDERDRIHGFLRKLVGKENGADLAQDLAQDTIEAAIKHIAEYRGEGFQINVWLRSIARNLYFQYVRRQKNNPKKTVSMDETANSIKISPESPEARLIKQIHERVAIEKTMGSLNPNQKETLRRFLEDRTPKEIAEETGIPLSAVKTNIHRIRKTLRRYL